MLENFYVSKAKDNSTIKPIANYTIEEFEEIQSSKCSNGVKQTLEELANNFECVG